MKQLFLFLLICVCTGILNAQETCNNGIDDDGNGFIDLNDPGCDCSGILTGVGSLIPNPSFEDTLCCPSTFTQLNCAETWIQASDATSDYFNLCGFTNISGFLPAPLPLPGTGVGYAGFYNMAALGGYQEMIGACLETPMASGVTYRFSLFLARASVFVTPLIVTIYGTPNCSDLPWQGDGCPVGIGSWIVLGADTVEFTDDSWQQATIEFDAPEDIYALAIGGPCETTSGGMSNYYYVDELIVASAAEFDLNARIIVSGKWCAGDLQLHAGIDTVGGAWQWYRAGIALPGETADSLNLMVYGTEDIYTAVYTLGGDCVSIEHTVDVEFFEEIIPDLISSPSCKGFSNGRAYLVTQPEDTSTFFYQWYSANDTTILSETDSLMNVPPGYYRVQINVSTGCDTTLYFEIPEVDFSVSFFPSDTIVCTGDIIQLTNTSDDHFKAYYWALDNGDTFSGDAPPPYAYADKGIYRVLLAGAGDVCADSTFQTIVVDAPVVPDFDVYPKALCVGQWVVLAPPIDSTVTQVEWQLADDKRTEASLQRHYRHTFDRSGVFPIKLKMHFRACPDAGFTDSIRVYAFPDVDLGSDSSICLHGQPLYLKNLREAPTTPYHQVWSTGDTTQVLKVVHPGFYTLSMTTEPIGCTTTESIEIKKDCYIDVPNAFTPNGDGRNDYFFPRRLISEAVSRFEMRVFNRWGQVIFETTNLNGRGWDGCFNGSKQPVGVYIYRIKADFANGRGEVYEDNVTLLR